MQFEKAHKELLAGRKIRRKEWEPLMHLKLIGDDVIAFRGEYSNFYDKPNILISNKWKVMDGEGQELTFIEALEELKNKKCITKEEWNEGWFVFVDKGQLAMCKPVQFDFMPSFQEMCATDWDIIK